MTGNSYTGWPRGRGYGAGHWFKRSVTSAGGAVHCFAKKLAKSSAFSVWFDTVCPSFVMSGIGSAGVVIRASAFAFLHHALLPSASVVSLSCCRCMKAVLAFLKAMLHWLRALWYACHASVVPGRFAAAKNRCFCRESLCSVEFIPILFSGEL